VVIGSNHDEMALFLRLLPTVIPGVSLPITAKSIPAMARHLTAYHDEWDDAIAHRIVTFYEAAAAKTAAYRVVRMGTELFFRCAARDAVAALSAHGVPAYLYHFNHHSSMYADPESLGCALDSEALCGVFHGAELFFVFDHPILASKADKAVAAALGTLWTNVAKYGTPNAPHRTDGVPWWPAYNQTDDMHLEIAAELSAGTGLAKESCDFWAALPKQTNYPH
jgi:carboxylesterase type B